ncbi:hypothetical protein OFN66_30340, partial [Escherichia coli]|nr:hypothetical protein [Escherichia coli]
VTLLITLYTPYVLRTHLHQSKKIEAGKSITEREEHHANGPAKWRKSRAKKHESVIHLHDGFMRSALRWWAAQSL